MAKKETINVNRMGFHTVRNGERCLKKIIFLILFLAVSLYNAYSQNNEYESDKITIANFLIKYCTFSDCNPTRQEEADSINFFVRKIFEEQYTSDNLPNLITQAFHLLYENSISEFEDSPDVNRMGIRRYMCFIALAWLSDEERYNTFLMDAEECLKRSEDSRGVTYVWEEKHIKERLIINMIELYKILDRRRAPIKKELKDWATSFQDDLRKV